MHVKSVDKVDCTFEQITEKLERKTVWLLLFIKRNIINGSKKYENYRLKGHTTELCFRRVEHLEKSH